MAVERMGQWIRNVFLSKTPKHCIKNTVKELWSSALNFIFLFLKIILLLFNYSCLHFLHPVPPSGFHPCSHPPPWFCLLWTLNLLRSRQAHRAVSAGKGLNSTRVKYSWAPLSAGFRQRVRPRDCDSPLWCLRAWNKFRGKTYITLFFN